MKKLNESCLDAIKQVIGELEANPNKVITSNLGSGCHARAYGENKEFHKIVIPGDTFAMAELQLYYLLFDLGVDCHLSDDQLKALDVLRH